MGKREGETVEDVGNEVRRVERRRMAPSLRNVSRWMRSRTPVQQLGIVVAGGLLVRRWIP